MRFWVSECLVDEVIIVILTTVAIFDDLSPFGQNFEARSN